MLFESERDESVPGRGCARTGEGWDGMWETDTRARDREHDVIMREGWRRDGREKGDIRREGRGDGVLIWELCVYVCYPWRAWPLRACCET